MGWFEYTEEMSSTYFEMRRKIIFKEINGTITIKTEDNTKKYKSLNLIPKEFKTIMSESFLKNPGDRYNYNGVEYRNLEEINDRAIRELIKNLDEYYDKLDKAITKNSKWIYKIFQIKNYFDLNEIEDENLRETKIKEELKSGRINNVYFCNQCRKKVLGKKTLLKIKCEFCGIIIKKL